LRFISFRDSLSLTQQGYEKFNRPPKSFSERFIFNDEYKEKQHKQPINPNMWIKGYLKLKKKK
jgi:hypothetical protein